MQLTEIDKIGERMRWVPFGWCSVVFALVLMSMGLTSAYGQNAGSPAFGQESGVLAVVDGKYVISEKDIDLLVGPEIRALKERIGGLRKGAVDQLVDSIILQQAARAKGITVDQLVKTMTPEKVEVDEAVVEQAFKARPPVAADKAAEVKTEIRHGLEIQMKQRAFKAAMAKLRSESKVQLFLETPQTQQIVVSETGPSKGSAQAPLTIVEFADFQCPYCRQEAPTLNELIRNYEGKVRLVFKQLPLPSHPRAFRAAEASVCAARQGKFWEYHDKLYSSENLSESALKQYGVQLGLNNGEFEKCLDQDAGRDSVLSDMSEGQAAGIRVTPSFVLNGKLLPGLQDMDTLKKELDAELAKIKQSARH